MTGKIATDSGFYHLTRAGWVRKDNAPFPNDRVETWSYELTQPSPAAKEQVRLTRIWTAPDADDDKCGALHGHFGEAISPNRDRQITLNCRT